MSSSLSPSYWGCVNGVRMEGGGGVVEGGGGEGGEVAREGGERWGKVAPEGGQRLGPREAAPEKGKSWAPEGG